MKIYVIIMFQIKMPKGGRIHGGFMADSWRIHGARGSVGFD